MPGTLYIVATPIGNLEDLSPRAARVLGQVMLVAAEDTRVTRKLLSHLGVRVPIISYNDHNAARRTPRILGTLVEGEEWRKQFPKLPLSPIGSLTTGGESDLSGGWDHFAG